MGASFWPLGTRGSGAHGGRSLQARRRETSLLLLLRQEPARSAQADRRTVGVRLRRVRGTLQRHHSRGTRGKSREDPRKAAEAARDQEGPRRVRHRPEQGQEGPVGRGLQPLQAVADQVGRANPRRHRARQEQHPADRPDRLRQDLAGRDARAAAERAVHDRRRDDADRSGLCRRGRREHHPEAAAEVRLRRREGADGHRLHRRDRQDLAQVGQPVDHARRLGRGRAAGAAEAHRRHDRLGAAAGRPQASAAGVPAGRHGQHPVHLRRRVRRPRKDHHEPDAQGRHRVRGGSARAELRASTAATCSTTSSRKT